jgi:small subunit ribosomal protein S16
VAVKLRLMRMGKKKQPTYRVVAADSRSPRNGRFIEIVGIYDPRQEPSAIRIDDAKALHWLRHGAKPTEQVQKLLQITGAWDRFKSGAPPLEPGAADAGADNGGSPAGEAAPAATADAGSEA